MTTRWIIGLASGSSIDGVDAALLEIEGAGLDLRVRPVLALHQPYARELRELSRRVATPGQTGGKEAGLLHRLLGETFAATARQAADRASLSLQRVQCLGCPGHTIWHEPDARFPSTLALGMAAVVAERTLGDYLLFRHPEESRALVHLGGLARVVYLPRAGGPQSVLGFEVGPCNLLLDDLVRRLTGGREEYDPGGKHGVQGHCLEPLLQRWLAHPYLQRRPPKSVPRPGYAEDLITQAFQAVREAGCSLHDLLCTATHFVARSVAAALRRFLPAGRLDRVLVSGGGVRNGLLWSLLENQMEGTPLEKTDGFGVPARARKAMGFGLLAALTVDGVPANLPATTGAAGSRLLGSLTPGSSANWARCLAWMAAQTAPLAADPEAKD
jgi:anhydro-N-acetylmuramic acid kinase